MDDNQGYIYIVNMNNANDIVRKFRAMDAVLVRLKKGVYGMYNKDDSFWGRVNIKLGIIHHELRIDVDNTIPEMAVAVIDKSSMDQVDKMVM